MGRRYASALLNLAVEQNALDVVTRDLHDFAATWNESRDLRFVFENPSVSQATRKQVLSEIAQSSGMHKLLRDTLMFVSDRGRLRELPQIVDAFDALAEQRSGRIRAEVVTASELPKEYFEGLKRTLEHATGKQVVISASVDPSIIGGVVTRLGDQVFDGSLQYRLNELREELSRGPTGR